jgi:uncharacterized protein (TIGR02678 family)
MIEAPSHQFVEMRAACRHLVVHPLVLGERDPETFLLVRRHEQLLDRWFTQRFGYRLQVTADTARLFKSTYVPRRRYLQTATSQPRPLSQREYTMLALAMAAVAAGPDVISLRDLVHEIRSAATDAEVDITTEPADRRATVTALRWMVHHGLAEEMHDHIERYVDDEGADAVLRIRPDRVALLPLPALASSTSAQVLVDRSDERTASRPWMRSQLLEEPVLYRSDLDEAEWAELRRRLGEEAAIFDEMFDVQIEARAEGLALVDEDGGLTDSAFPRTGTVGHVALLLLDHLVDEASGEILDRRDVLPIVADLVAGHRKYWSKLADEPERLADEALALLEDHRLVAIDGSTVHVLAAAWRYTVEESASGGGEEPRLEQGSLL